MRLKHAFLRRGNLRDVPCGSLPLPSEEGKGEGLATGVSITFFSLTRANYKQATERTFFCHSARPSPQTLSQREREFLTTNPGAQHGLDIWRERRHDGINIIHVHRTQDRTRAQSRRRRNVSRAAAP